MTANPNIAVVVPFYKITYFRELLEALRAQTDKRFNVYVGNDASDPDAEKAVSEFAGDLDIQYHRFETRMGHMDLAGQWNRCLELVGKEEWVWVMPDDDLPSENCVESIREAISLADEQAINIIHIPLVMVNKRGEGGSTREDCQPVMDSGDFYMAQLTQKIGGTTLGNVVYRKSALQAIGGFISLPKAWGSDHATMLCVADGGKVAAATKAELKFRMSGENVTSDTGDSAEKIEARKQYCRLMARKLPQWYGDELAEKMLYRLYFMTEFFAMKVWPASASTLGGLFEIAKICGVEQGVAKKGLLGLRYIQSVTTRKKIDHSR